NFTGSSKFIGISNVLGTWLGARNYCRQHHTDLAISFNSTDSSYLRQLRDAQ
ncbi:macrophage mannose receptor 1-like isoform X6, partial [Clarias magur]